MTITMESKLQERLAAKDEARKRQSERELPPGKLTARQRIEELVDPGTFQEIDLFLTSAESEFNPTIAGKTTDGVITGYAEVNGRPIYVWSQDSDILGGSVGVVHAKKITWLYEKALQLRVPVVGFIDSIGERARGSG